MVSGWHIMVSAGQSNECEIGDGAYQSQDTSNDSRIFQVGRYNGNDMQVVQAVPPLDYVTYGTRRGAGMPRARAYISNGFLPADFNLLIIPAAASGTSILEWNGTLNTRGLGNLYADMCARVNVGMALPNAKLKMVVWRQGETDATYVQGQTQPLMPNVHTWYMLTLAMWDQFRATYGNVPIIYSKFTDPFVAGHPTTYRTFLRAIEAMAAARSLSAVTETTGLAANNGDTIHFTAASQEIIAARNIADYGKLLSGTLTANFLGIP